MKFYLGTHQVHWVESIHVPFMLSWPALRRRVSGLQPRAKWILDSGGFSELSLHGKWTADYEWYKDAVQFYQRRKLEWCAPFDWMCEPGILQKTGLTIWEHQVRTTDSVLRFQQDNLPVIPVLQGWTLADYERHARLYERNGIRLCEYPTVGLGTICRRQNTKEATGIIRALAAEGLRLHGFGLKTTGLARVHRYITSADSMAWSFAARRMRRPTCGSTTHKNCANCKEWALQWRWDLLRRLA